MYISAVALSQTKVCITYNSGVNSNIMICTISETAITARNKCTI